MCESYHEPSQRENQNKEENKNVKEDLRENNNSWKCSNKQNKVLYSELLNQFI